MDGFFGRLVDVVRLDALYGVDEAGVEAQTPAAFLAQDVLKDGGVAAGREHRDQRFAMDDLLRESVYADLLVIDSRETMSVEKENAPTGFIRQLLTEVQCPVFLVNEQFVDVDKVIMLFDGSPSAVHAIKMFNYTVPALNLLPLEILTVNAAYAGNHTPDNQLMKEFMKRVDSQS